MKKLIMLMLAAVMLLASCGGRGGNTGDSGDGSTNVPSDTNVSLGNALDVPFAEMRDAIALEISKQHPEAKWGIITETGTIDGSIRCYGIFNDCAVIFDEAGDKTETTVTVAGHTFSHGSQFVLYGYKDGTLRKLDEAYKAGLVTEAEIGTASARHSYVEKLPQYVERFNKTIKEKIIVPDEKTRSEIEKAGAESDERFTWREPPQFPERDTGERCYGTVNGCTVIFQETMLPAETTETIAGYEFFHSCSFVLLCYRDGAIYYLDKAYESGLLTKEDVGVFAERHGFSEEYDTFCAERNLINYDATVTGRTDGNGETT